MIFTIAIPTYNNAETFEDALLSALNQNFLDYEILVIDNCSSDGTQEILRNYSYENLRIINNPYNVSMWENHNICLKNSRGKYVVFCHSDDRLKSDCLLKMEKHIVHRGFPTKYVLWGRSFFRDFSGVWQRFNNSFNHLVCGPKALEIFQIGGITPSGTCYSKDSFLANGGFIPTKYEVGQSDFFSLWLLIMDGFEFEMSDELFFYRMSSNIGKDLNKSSQIKYQSFLDGIRTVFGIMDTKAKAYIIDFLIKTEMVNPLLYRCLLEEKYISRKILRMKVIKSILKRPTFIFRESVLSLLFI